MLLFFYVITIRWPPLLFCHPHIIFHYWQFYAGGITLAAVYALCSLNEVLVGSEKYVRHVVLGIAVIQGKPGALYLHHNAMPLLKHVIYLVQPKCIFLHLPRLYRFRHTRNYA